MTKIVLSADAPTTAKADVLVIVVPHAGEDDDSALVAVDDEFDGALAQHLNDVEFKAAKGGIVSIPTLGRFVARQVIVVGVREEATSSNAALTEAVAVGVRQSLGHRPKQVAIALPREADVRAAALGARLGAYRFDRYQTGKKTTRLGTIALLVPKVHATDRKQLAVGSQLGEGVCLARDLVNEPPNVLYPESFSRVARIVAKRHGLTCKVMTRAALEKAGHRLHVAVGQGSSKEPCLIHLTYKPKNAKKRIAFVGKGLTFDSGGLCIKPMQGMDDMKSDMAGGAAVLGLMEALAAIAPNVEVHGIIGAAENMPDADAYRPADVVKSLSGKTVEVINTDAEGRLVLADALTYASRLKPDFIVDAATLTGATLVSLGPPYSAFFTGSDAIAEAMDASAKGAGESFWRMPLIEELRAQLDSDIADLKHMGERWGGAITAALFLREFTGGVPWMHCDIPGAVLRNRAVGMHPKGGTGHAVLTFAALVERHAKEPILGTALAPKVGAKAKSVPKAGAAKSGSAMKTRASKAGAASKASSATKVGVSRPKKSPAKARKTRK